MFTQIVIGTLLIAITVVIHAVVLDRLMVTLGTLGPEFFKIFHKVWKVPLLTVTVLGVFTAHIIEIWLWAFFYLGVGALDGLEAALYFSTTTFTTVGYGDVVLGQDWRLISAFQAGNGFILFGWSTAFIFEVMSKLYEQEQIKKS